MLFHGQTVLRWRVYLGKERAHAEVCYARVARTGDGGNNKQGNQSDMVMRRFGLRRRRVWHFDMNKD